ncbi:MAG TPA: hypothetical protein VK783_12100 [Bacteroidia bacterium]|jgi:ketosteroid isomerase-like protein|nr:hypothetical protein [Bacteroidia bacterium]
MKKHLLLIPALAFIFFACNNCNTAPADDSKATEAVIQADKDFNNYCAKHGLAAGFIKFADSSQVSLGQGSLPLRGLAALRKSLEKDLADSSVSKLTWGPEKGEASGSIGYTYGPWKLVSKTKAGNDTVLHGYYVTVWKLQKDGTWKYVLDGGNDTPDPDKK